MAAFADIRVFAQNSTEGPHILAVGPAADALASQGFEQTKARNNVSVTYQASAVVLWASAQAADVGRILIDSNERKAYRITAFSFSVSVTLDRTYEGPAGAGFAHFIEGPAAGVPPFNPPLALQGGFLA